MRMMGAALAGMALDPLQSVITHHNSYVNKRLGIMFDKPEGWGFIEVKNFGQLKENQILGSGHFDHMEEVWEEIDDPICIATKFPDDLNGLDPVFSPTITLHVTHRDEMGELHDADFQTLMALSEMGVSMMLRDFKVIHRHEPVEISGYPFYTYDAEYRFEHVAISEPLPVSLRVLKARQGDFFYDFNCHHAPLSGQSAESEFAAFEKSIVLL